MRYLLLLHGDESAENAMTDAERRAMVEQHADFSRSLRDAGTIIVGEPLGSSGEARIVRDSGVTDGPFAETKEQLGGFYLIECGSMDEAVAIAHRVPQSPGLAVEVRAIPAF